MKKMLQNLVDNNILTLPTIEDTQILNSMPLENEEAMASLEEALCEKNAYDQLVSIF